MAGDVSGELQVPGKGYEELMLTADKSSHLPLIHWCLYCVLCSIKRDVKADTRWKGLTCPEGSVINGAETLIYIASLCDRF